MRRDEAGQLQVIEAIIVGMMVLLAIALVSIFQLPSAPATFQDAELERLGADSLRFLANQVPNPASDCNETPCPFANRSELERYISLALGYVGPTGGLGETPDDSLVADYLGQALPDGVRYILRYSNGVNATTITPLDRTPPRLNVVVAHHFMAPNWTMWSANVAQSVLLRIGETTGFGPPTEILDPLNRATNEFGLPWTARFAPGFISDDAMLGTHRVCFGAACHFLTVVPPGLAGPGSQILPGDRDNATRIKTLGPFASHVKYFDADASSTFEFAEDIYVDLASPGSNTVGVGDLRLSIVPTCRAGAECPAGSFVEAGDSDFSRALTPLPASAQVRGADADGDGFLDAGEGIYLADNDAAIEADERRLSRIGVHRSGSSFQVGDSDPGALSLTFSNVNILWGDTDDDGIVDPVESVYLDLDGSGQGPGLEERDFHVTPLGAPTERFVYDILLVVWFAA